MMCVKHAPRLNRLRRTALLRSFVANVLWQTSQYSLLFDLISRMTVQIDRTFLCSSKRRAGSNLIQSRDRPGRSAADNLRYTARLNAFTPTEREDRIKSSLDSINPTFDAPTS